MAVSASIAAVGSPVWVWDPELPWIDGEVVEVNGQEIKVTCTSGKIAVANVSNIYPKDPEAPSCGVHDVTKLAYLHEPGVLQNLRSRYDMNEIYDIEKFKLGNPRMFHYLNQSNCYELDGIDDSKDYLSTRRAMDVVGISSNEQDAIFQVVEAILHLGNNEFAKDTESDASLPKNNQSRFHLKTAAELLIVIGEDTWVAADT